MTRYAAETANGLSRAPKLMDRADDTGEGLFAIRDRPADWTADCVARTSQLRTLPNNWNSYGANAVDVRSIECAIQLVRVLSQVTGIECPRIAASPAGYATLSWEWHSHARELDVEVLPDGRLRYGFVDEDDGTDIERATSDVNEVAHILTKW